MLAQIVPFQVVFEVRCKPKQDKSLRPEMEALCGTDAQRRREMPWKKVRATVAGDLVRAHCIIADVGHPGPLIAVEFAAAFEVVVVALDANTAALEALMKDGIARGVNGLEE